MLWVYLGLVVLSAIALPTALVHGWRPIGLVMPPLGSTQVECEAAFGRPFDVSSNMEGLHRPSRLYAKHLWAIIVSNDEQGRAEQFIISKAMALPSMGSPAISDDEQKTLLGKFSGMSSWQSSKREDFGLTWTRKDEQAYAYYDTDRRWLTVMNRTGVKRQLKSVNMELIDEPTPKPESPR